MMNLVPKLNLAIIPLVLGLVLALSHTVTSDPNTSISSYLCNFNSYPEGGSFEEGVTFVLRDMRAVTPVTESFNYYTQSYTLEVAYGYATCSGPLSTGDCAYCLAVAEDCLRDYCKDRIGGQMQLVDCTMRYENYDFS